MSVEVGWPLYLELEMELAAPFEACSFIRKWSWRLYSKLEVLKHRAAPRFGATTSEAVFLCQHVLFRSFLTVVQNCVLNRCMSFFCLERTPRIEFMSALQLRLFLYIELDSEVDINSLGPWGAQPSIIMEKFKVNPGASVPVLSIQQRDIHLKTQRPNLLSE